MSKVETAVDDSKKLAQRCKALEAQLRQTITKKEHHEIVLEFEDKLTGMEKSISSQDKKIAEYEKEITRTKSELQKSAALSKQIADVGAQIAAVTKASEAQGKTADALLFKVSQGTVPEAVHQQSLSRVKDLEEQVAGMVSRNEYSSLQRRYDEAVRQLSGMVPASDYEALKERVQELEGAMSSMVLREQLESSEATVKELKAKLEEHVPQSTYDELVSKVVQLAEEVTGGRPSVEDQESLEFPEVPTAADRPSPVEPKPTMKQEVPSAPASVKAEPPSQEIREVGTQLAELKTEAIVEQEPEVDDSRETLQGQNPPKDEVEMSDPSYVISVASSEEDGQQGQD